MHGNQYIYVWLQYVQIVKAYLNTGIYSRHHGPYPYQFSNPTTPHYPLRWEVRTKL